MLAELSAQAGYGGSPDYLIDTNLVGCYHCLELARRAKADFVFISTSRVYPYSRLNALAFEEGENVLSSPRSGRGGRLGIRRQRRLPLDCPRSL